MNTEGEVEKRAATATADSEKEESPKTTPQDGYSPPSSSSPRTDKAILGWTLPEQLQPYAELMKGAGGVCLALFLVFPDQLIRWIWNLVWTVVGVTLGVGFGAGLALHIFHQLQDWQKTHDKGKEDLQQQQQQQKDLRSSRRNSKRKSTLSRADYSHSSSHPMSGNNGTLFLEDGNSYLSLMAQAGYSIPDRVLRGQVLREDHKFWDINYKFTDDKIPDQHAVHLMADQFPTLPEPVTREMGRFIEHVMRDYVSGWFCRLDHGIVFRNEGEKRADGIPRDGGDTVNSTSDTNRSRTDSTASTGSARKQYSSSASDGASGTPSQSQAGTGAGNDQTPAHVARNMVFSTLTHRRAPMIDATYHVVASAFGNLATRMEHVNVLELVLLKWTQVLGHTFKTYRTLRKAAQDKNAGHRMTERSPSEVEIAREYLLAGKLHRALVFGLDVPSLLFAGDEYGCGTDETPRNSMQVLEQRLYHTNMIKECELDYNRVLASRLIRALIPKSESNSLCVMALVTEIFAGCVFQPLMNLWTPSFLNDIVVKAMSSTPELSSDTQQTVGNNRQVKDSSTNDHSIPVESATDESRLINEGVSERIGDTPTDPFAAEIERPGEILASTASASSDDTDILGVDVEVSLGDKLLTLAAMALAEMATFVDYEAIRSARENDQEAGVDWDDPNCAVSALRLVMVIEAAMIQGRCRYRAPIKEVAVSAASTPENSPDEAKENVVEDNSDLDTNDTMPQETFTHLLMEMTSDMTTFEKRIDDYMAIHGEPPLLQERMPQDFSPDADEVSTLRTLICTWLHTGQLYKALSLVCKASGTLFAPFYGDESFITAKGEGEKFVREMKSLDGVDIMVETMIVLSSPPLDVSEEHRLMTSSADKVSASRSNNNSPQRHALHRSSDAALSADSLARDFATFGENSIPRFVDFQRNEAFSSSLRAERDRRLRAWETRKADESKLTVIRKTASKKIDFDLHSELHNLSRLFYNGTNIMSIRDAARRGDEGEEEARKNARNEKVSLLTVETVSNRRRIEVPDEDSSFLLRAQSRPLNPVSVHRSEKNHDMSYKTFSATYEEPAIAAGSSRYNGGRLVRRCLVQYYPSDRTASIVLQSDARKLDRRKGRAVTGETSSVDQNRTPYVNGTFLKQKHLCTKGDIASQSFLSSSLMESTDFNAAPRSGKALDFVYRMSLFERPVIDLAGKRFTVQDSSSRTGAHRADSSSLEMSDASLSYLLLYVGKDWVPRREVESNELRHTVEMGPDGYPMIFFKVTTKVGDQVSTEIKPYRVSFVRAALMVTSSRQEAQQASLIECVKAGSAKSATKARTEERLRPVLKILDFANDKSKDQNRASCLSRDLKLGIYHIDREQLRRNGLLSLRYPTTVLQLNAKVEGTAKAKDVPLAKLVSHNLPPDEILYKIRCTAVVELDDSEESMLELEPYALDDGSIAALYREEWVVYRSMKDFQTLHKQLKSQVSTNEASMSTGTRIVGAATAALSTRTVSRKNKKLLIPSLAQAGKIGAMGVTQRSITKRVELLDEYIGYLLSSNSLMNRCSELLLFLGASHPFPPEVTVTKAPANFMDPLGRMEFIRSVALKESGDVVRLKRKFSPRKALKQQSRVRSSSVTSSGTNGAASSSKAYESSSELIDMDPGIASKVDQIALSEVRNHIVELMRYSFGFENASFVRSQMLAALETASFVAIAKQSDFRRVLYHLHSQKLNGDALGGYIRSLLDLLWPGGVWAKPRPLLTKEEEDALRRESLAKLRAGFPDSFRKILGKELTEEGLDMIHDMLQNRLIVKSMFYMLLDLVWIEILPEMRDFLPCASGLDLHV
ncbi:MAG: hypothetical protein SGILL_001077 [Bacillariaceae sp.]